MLLDRIDSHVNCKRFHQLSDEFTNVWKQLRVLYLDAAAGVVLCERMSSRSKVRLAPTCKGVSWTLKSSKVPAVHVRQDILGEFLYVRHPQCEAGGSKGSQRA